MSKNYQKKGHPVAKGIGIALAVLLVGGAVVGVGVGTNWFTEGFKTENLDASQPDLQLAKYKATEGLEYIYDSAAKTATLKGLGDAKAEGYLKFPETVTKDNVKYDVVVSSVVLRALPYVGFSGILIPQVSDTQLFPTIDVHYDYVQYADGYESIPMSIVDGGSYRLPASAKTLLQGSFQGNSVASLDLSQFKTLPISACQNCCFLDDVELSDELVSLGSYSFGSCSMLKSLVLPSTCVSIEDNAFYGCFQMEDIVIQGAPTIGTGAFLGCRDLTIYTNNVDLTYFTTDYVDEGTKVYTKGQWMYRNGKVVLADDAEPTTVEAAASTSSSAA